MGLGALQISAFNLAQKDHAMPRISRPEWPKDDVTAGVQRPVGSEDPGSKKSPLQVSACLFISPVQLETSRNSIEYTKREPCCYLQSNDADILI